MASIYLNIDLSSTLSKQDIFDITLLLKSYKSALEVGALGEESPVMVERIDDLVEKLNTLQSSVEEAK